MTYRLSENELEPKGVSFALLCSASVGLHIVLSKLALQHGDPFVPLCYLALMTCVYSAVPLINNRRFLSDLRQAKAIAHVWMHSLLASAGMIFCWLGLSYLSPTIVSFVGRVEVLFSVLTAVIFLGETVNRRKIIGFAFGALGVLILSYPDRDIAAKGWQAFVDPALVFVLLSATCYGCCEIFAVKAARDVGIRTFVFLRSVFACANIWLVTSFRVDSFPIEMDTLTILAVVAFLGPFLGRQLFMVAVERIPLSIAIGLNQTQPLFAAIFSLFFVMELPNLRQWAGGVTIIISCIFLVRSRAKQKRRLLLEPNVKPVG